jgi:transcription regulator MmyB-like protein
VDAKSEIRDFLTSRRARLTPDRAGLRTFAGGARRVPGLRREEVALLAGVSVDYYTRLERAILVRRASTSTGIRSHTTSSRCCTPRPAAIPTDRDLSALVGELSTRSDAFRTLWAAHDVHLHDTGVKRFHHPIVGDLTVTYENLELAADPG